MKKQAIFYVLAAGLFVSVAQAGSISCPDIPAGTHSYGSQVNGWVLMFSQGDTITFSDSVKWPAASAGDIVYGTGGFYRNPTCINMSKGYSLTYNGQADYYCDKSSSGSKPSYITESCATNSFHK